MKTPEEIKKGLEACRADECHGHHTGCPYDDDFFCIMHICGDALAYIEQVEKHTSLNALRDAIYEDAVKHGLWEKTDGPMECAFKIYDEYYELACAAMDLQNSILIFSIDESEALSYYAEELADVIIMSLSVAGKLGIDIDKAVRRKMEINKRLRGGRKNDCVE